MKNNIIRLLLLSGVIAGFSACVNGSQKELAQERTRYEFGNILDIEITPDSTTRRVGCFTDAGSWMGFTIDHRIWFAQSSVVAGLIGETSEMTPDSTSYFPGEVYMSSVSADAKIDQRMNFIDSSTALLQVETNSEKGLCFTGKQWSGSVKLEVERNVLTARHHDGEIITLTFDSDITLSCDGKNYIAQTQPGCKKTDVAISFFVSEKELPAYVRSIEQP